MKKVSSEIKGTMDVIFYEHVRSTLYQYSNPERAAKEQKYHKSQREHWGVSVPRCELVARTIAQGKEEAELLPLVSTLWATDLFDLMICAGKILSLSQIRPTEEVWNLLLSFLGSIDGWALEDNLAHVAWKCILADESRLDTVERWTLDANLWMRRAALVYTLPFAKPQRNPERPLQWASLYASDKEWFIQKAIGWWLRVLGEHNPQRVLLFLENYGRLLKSIAWKEATRKLDPKWLASWSCKTS